MLPEVPVESSTGDTNENGVCISQLREDAAKDISTIKIK
jgi:hypothetical protein